MTSHTLSTDFECMCNTKLKRALGANAMFSALSGVALVLAAPIAAELLFSMPLSVFGFGAVTILRMVGIGLILFALAVGWAGRQERPVAPIVTAISLADFGWVIGSVLLLGFAAPTFTTMGIAMIGTIGLIVLGFGVAQLGALRHRA